MVFPALEIVNAIEFGIFCRENHSITNCTIFLGLIRPRSVSGQKSLSFVRMVDKHKKKLKTYFLNMDLEKLMTSSWASGFPQFMTEILEHMDFEDLLKTCLHCRKKIGDVLVVSEQVRIICRSLGIRNDQFVEH